MPGTFFQRLTGTGPKDIGLPLPKGAKRDPRLPNPEGASLKHIAEGLRTAQQATKAKK